MGISSTNGSQIDSKRPVLLDPSIERPVLLDPSIERAATLLQEGKYEGEQPIVVDTNNKHNENKKQHELLLKGKALYDRVLALEEHNGRGSFVSKESLTRAHGGDFDLLVKIDEDGDQNITLTEWETFLQREVDGRNLNSPTKGTQWLRSFIHTFEVHP